MNIAQAICKKATFGWLFLWVCPVLNKGGYVLKLNCERVIGLALNGLLLPIKLDKIKGMTGNCRYQTSDQFKNDQFDKALCICLRRSMRKALI